MDESKGGSSEFFSNSLGMMFRHVWVPNPIKMRQSFSDPLHNKEVVKSDFSIGIHLITQHHYWSLVGENPSYFQGERMGDQDTEKNPVEYVSCAQAVKFCRLLSALPAERRLQRRYRLPTLAEWEHAYLAGGDFRPESSGDLAIFGEYAWIEENSDARTHPVGLKKANPWGIYDMGGNVQEWCLDVHVREITEYTKLDFQSTPHFECAFRGGDFGCSVAHCGVTPIHRTNSYTEGNFIGFRVVLETVPALNLRGVGVTRQDGLR
jgi:formylglycine-generating enzyme required for sulfatase activity